MKKIPFIATSLLLSNFYTANGNVVTGGKSTAKITISGHQIELKMYEHHFYKADWEELDRLIEAA